MVKPLCLPEAYENLDFRVFQRGICVLLQRSHSILEITLTSCWDRVNVSDRKDPLSEALVVPIARHHYMFLVHDWGYDHLIHQVSHFLVRLVRVVADLFPCLHEVNLILVALVHSLKHKAGVPHRGIRSALIVLQDSRSLIDTVRLDLEVGQVHARGAALSLSGDKREQQLKSRDYCKS